MKERDAVDVQEQQLGTAPDDKPRSTADYPWTTQGTWALAYPIIFARARDEARWQGVRCAADADDIAAVVAATLSRKIAWGTALLWAGRAWINYNTHYAVRKEADRRYKHAARFVSGVQQHLPEAFTEDTAQDDCVGNETAERLAQAVNTLPRRERQVFRLRYEEEMKHAEIAERLPCTEEASRAALCRARGKLEKLGFALPQDNDD